MVLGLGVIIVHIGNLPVAFSSIIKGAFNPTAVTGGVVGAMFTAVQKGVARGIFSNEAGLGTASIAHAGAEVNDPVQQGLFGVFEVFVDTIIICTFTALVILCSGVPITFGSDAGAELTISGFTSTYGNWITIFTAVAMCCFAFTTIWVGAYTAPAAASTSSVKRSSSPSWSSIPWLPLSVPPSSSISSGASPKPSMA